jgi:putative ABC transport system ATP-binding protein
LGALVAVLAAYKDLAPPWRELLNFYQTKEDSRIKYDQIVEQFEPGRMTSARLLEEPEKVELLGGELIVTNLSLVEDDRIRVIDGIGFTIPAGSHVAIIGQGSSGKGELAQLLAGLIEPTSGRITIGGRDLASLPAAVTGRRIGYVGATPYLFAGTLYDNFLLALRHRPIRPAAYEPAAEKRREKELYEARKSGNIAFDLKADWIDYQSAGVADEKELLERIGEVLDRLDFAEDVYGFGLRCQIDPEKNPEAAARFLEARKSLAARLRAEGITSLVESWDPERYNQNASLAENLLFGTPIGPAFEYDALARNTYVERVLAKTGLIEDLVEAGRKVAETMIELFADLPPGHEFFERYSFIGADELPEYAAILARIGKSGIEGLSKADRTRLLSLPLKLVAARHRLDVLDEAMQERLIEARRVFRADLPSEARQQIAFFDPERYHAAASVQDNILFGKIAYGEAEAPLRIPLALREVIDALDLRRMVIEVGLNTEVGSGGARLSPAQRQKAALVRSVLKRPDPLILNEATAALDGPAQAAVLRGLREEMSGRGLLWALHRASLARHFDRVLVMSNGKLQEQGRFSELDRKDSLMSLLVAAD